MRYARAMRTRAAVRVSLVALGVLALGAGRARADTGGYRGEIAAVDSATTAALFGYLFASHSEAASPIVLLAGLAVVAGPIDHAGHGEYDRAGLSLGLHLALPTLGGVIGAATKPGFDGLVDAVVGVVIGHVAAIAADVYLAKAEHAPDAMAARTLSFGGSF